MPPSTHKTGLRLLGPGGEEFVVREQLALRGQGPLGDVHRAEGITSGHEVEVKFLPSYPLAHSRAAVLNEIEMARKVLHPNVLAVLHIAPDQADPPGPYLMTEHTSEGSLQDEIHRRKRDAMPFELASARSMLVDVSHGMQAIHAHLIHRDVSRQNIRLKGKRLKVAGFGLSKLIGAETRVQTFKGLEDMSYAAPEIWNADSDTPQLDVYACGLLFFEILTLEHPLRPDTRGMSTAEKLLAWRQAHIEQRLPDVRDSREDVPDALAELLADMCEKAPHERPAWDDVLEVLESLAL